MGVRRNFLQGVTIFKLVEGAENKNRTAVS